MRFINKLAMNTLSVCWGLTANINFGKNLFTWFQTNVKYLVLVAIASIGTVLIFKREFTKLIMVGVVGIIAVLCVWNPNAVQTFLLALGNKIIGAK